MCWWLPVGCLSAHLDHHMQPPEEQDYWICICTLTKYSLSPLHACNGIMSFSSAGTFPIVDKSTISRKSIMHNS